MGVAGRPSKREGGWSVEFAQPSLPFKALAAKPGEAGGRQATARMQEAGLAGQKLGLIRIFRGTAWPANSSL